MWGIFKRVIKKGLAGKMTFLQKSEGDKGVSQADIWEREFKTEEQQVQRL